MASIQLSSSGNAPKPFTQFQVQTRKKIDADDWQTQDYLEVLSFTQSVAPNIPKASFRWRSGRIKREDKTQFDDVEYTSFADQFVRIVKLPDPNTQQPNQGANNAADPQPVWTGVVRDDQGSILGDDIVASADQIIVAYGLEELLDRTVIRKSIVVDRTDEDSAIEIGVPLIFNERYILGMNEVGNRSSEQYDFNFDDDPEDPETTEAQILAYVFSKDNEVWTVRDICEYLLANAPTSVSFTLGGQDAVLKNYILPRENLEGMTTYAALNKLIDRRRGLGWCLRPADDDDPAKWTVHVFTTFTQTVKVGSSEVEGNQEADDLNTTGKREPEEVNIQIDSLTRYGTITVTGEPILVTCSFSLQDDNLEKVWTDDQEKAYLKGADKSGTDKTSIEANDTARDDVKLRPVFTSFRVPTDWDFKAADGEGSGYKVAMNIGVKDDGSIDTDNPSSIRNWGHTFERSLPIKKPKGVDDHRPEFEPPMVFLKNSDGWVHADHHSLQSKHICHLYSLDTDFGFYVHTSPNHVLAGDSWDDTAKPSALKTAEFDFATMIITAAFRLDEMIKVNVQIGSGDFERVKHIHVPSAEFWCMAPGTCIGIDPDGKLRRPGKDDPKQIRALSTGMVVLRDDTDHLQAIGAQAKAWYGTSRAVLHYVTREIDFGYAVGSLIKNHVDSGGNSPINSVVTSKTFDAIKGTTSFATAFGELDFGANDLANARGGI